MAQARLHRLEVSTISVSVRSRLHRAEIIASVPPAHARLHRLEIAVAQQRSLHVYTDTGWKPCDLYVYTSIGWVST